MFTSSDVLVDVQVGNIHQLYPSTYADIHTVFIRHSLKLDLWVHGAYTYIHQEVRRASRHMAERACTSSVLPGDVLTWVV